eukprot:CAMPEP_0116564256 /NCGR_PEP_ID=MMETSP0397-20121206/13204_1 /TAXON_ID=216820 /ORGANISM="Cyclophora tenuis, Strain ECT3854" /LENGTH=174 /DNA_ID=CAMNT_0004090823 /DNA_START=41 /DNA_END=561 /DNA_ORIENTATION=-
MTLLEECLQKYVGTHDFRAFAGGMEQLERRLAKEKASKQQQTSTTTTTTTNPNNNKHPQQQLRRLPPPQQQQQKQKQQQLQPLVSILTVQSIGAQLIYENDDGENEGHFRMEFHLQGALYKMIRTMVGTALDVACSKLDVATFDQLLKLDNDDNNNNNNNENDNYDSIDSTTLQ